MNELLLSPFRPTTLFAPTRELAAVSLRCRFPALLTDASGTHQPGCRMDCAVGLFRHGAPLLCEIAICQAASSVFLAPTASFPPIGQMLLVFGGGLLPSAGSDAPGAEQLGF